MITSTSTESKKTREFNIIVYLKTQKKKEKGGGDGMNLIMGCNLVKPKSATNLKLNLYNLQLKGKSRTNINSTIII